MVVSNEEKGPKLGVRHVQTFLLFLCILVNYMGRLNVSIAVVAMTNAETTNPHFDEFDWDEKQKSYILSSFYWGYIITQFPACYMCRRFGAKITILISTFGSAILSLITPLCISFGGWQIYCGIRTLQGMLQGLFYPCFLEHLAKWSPVEERTRLGGLSHTGMEIGTILAMTVTGLIAESSMGWPGISYVSGAMGVAWCVLWIIFADNTPNTSRFITLEEKKYILTSQAKVDGGIDECKTPIPWKAIMTSIPFISLIIVRAAEAWGYSTVQAEIPTYLHSVLGMNIKSNAFFSGLPYLVMFILCYVYIIVADILTKRKIMTLSALRKTINSISMWVPAASLIGIGFLNESQMTLAVVLLTATVGINAGVTIGSGLNAIDLSPNHAVILMGIINTAVSLISLITPLFVGLIVHNETDRWQWYIVFLISAVVFFLGNLQYIFLGSIKTQPWNDKDFLFPNRDVECHRDYNVISCPKLSHLTINLEDETKNTLSSQIRIV